MTLILRPLIIPPWNSLPVEIVERKGLGHPDTMCDALAEELSTALCRFYFQEFGCLLHHNVDKALLWGGSARPAFGGGKILAPMEIFLAGRATTEFQGIEIPVAELAAKSCRDWLRRSFHALDPERHVKLHCLVRPASADLAELYARAAETGVWLANDTSCGVGYAPLSPLERVVYQVERQLNSAAVKQACPEIGEDIKVMGIRRDGAISLTLACAFIGRYLDSPDDYCEKKARLEVQAKEIARQVTDLPVSAAINTADDPESGSFYLTVTGTSAEAGDDGQVGRGNRANGLICPYRPMTLEAAAGKNPITHVGKLYNIAANQIAGKIVAEIPEVTTAYCYLVSQIGKPVREPQFIDVQLQVAGGSPVEPLRQTVEAIAGEILASLDTLWQRLVAGEFLIY
jgi:S-adenosylmethionine synthetase